MDSIPWKIGFPVSGVLSGFESSRSSASLLFKTVNFLTKGNQHLLPSFHRLQCLQQDTMPSVPLLVSRNALAASQDFALFFTQFKNFIHSVFLLKFSVESKKAAFLATQLGCQYSLFGSLGFTLSSRELVTALRLKA